MTSAQRFLLEQQLSVRRQRLPGVSLAARRERGLPQHPRHLRPRHRQEDRVPVRHGYAGRHQPPQVAAGRRLLHRHAGRVDPPRRRSLRQGGVREGGRQDDEHAAAVGR